MIQADWKAVGVDAEIVSYEWGEYLKRTKEGEHETVLLGWTGDNGDPDNFLFALLSCEAVKAGNNRARWCNKEFNDLITKAQRSSDLAERTKLYEEAQVVFKREAPVADDRALGRLSAAGQERGRLQDRPVRRAHLLRRRHQGLMSLAQGSPVNKPAALSVG